MSAPNEVTLTLRRKDMEMVVFALHIQAKQCEDANNEFAAHAYRRIAAALADPAPAAPAEGADTFPVRLDDFGIIEWALEYFTSAEPGINTEELLERLQFSYHAAMRRAADQGQAGGGQG